MGAGTTQSVAKARDTQSSSSLWGTEVGDNAWVGTRNHQSPVWKLERQRVPLARRGGAGRGKEGGGLGSLKSLFPSCFTCLNALQPA